MNVTACVSLHYDWLTADTTETILIFPVTCLTSLPWLVLYVILWPGTSTAPGTQLTLSILWVTTGN